MVVGEGLREYAQRMAGIWALTPDYKSMATINIHHEKPATVCRIVFRRLNVQSRAKA
jgi:hypothetical protein